MKLIAIILASALVVVGALLSMDALAFGSLQNRAQRLKVGDTKTRVKSVLGHPTAVFTPAASTETNAIVLLLSVTSETWAYGSRCEWRSEFPYFSGIRLRLFGPTADDVAVVFNDAGKVARVTVPE